MKKPYEIFYNTVVRQGNSLCVRISNKIVQKLDIKEGTIVALHITNLDKETKKLPEELYTAYHTVRDFKQFSLSEIREFLNYYAIEQSAGHVIKIDKSYEQFKRLLRKKENKAKIMEAMKKTAYWKKLEKTKK